MLLIFLDTETTGLDPMRHRAIEIALEVVDAKTDRMTTSYETLIWQPRSVIEAADLESLKVNGLHLKLIEQGKPEGVVAEEIKRLFHQIDLSNREGFFICQNPSFDRPFFQHLISVDEIKELKWPYHWLDLASMYWALHSAGISKEKQLSKNAIAQALGLARESEPHRAMNGVKHLRLCYQTLFQQSDVSQVRSAQGKSSQ